MNQGNRIIQVAVPRPLHAVYDYSVPESMPIPNVGARLKVPFGGTQTIGVCVNVEVTAHIKAPSQLFK
jgi:primosomal protein N' (replication factor Y)